MSTLARDLIDEHRNIICDLDEINTFGVCSKNGHNKLYIAFEKVLLHLTKESDLLYPALKKVAVNNRELCMLLKAFMNEADNIASSISDFIDKHPVGNMGEEFWEEFAGIVKDFYSRMGEERSLLLCYARVKKLSFAANLNAVA